MKEEKWVFRAGVCPRGRGFDDQRIAEQQACVWASSVAFDWI
jgi:hypothetical protein